MHAMHGSRANPQPAAQKTAVGSARPTELSTAGTKVLVSNLGPDVSSDDLSELFEEHGGPIKKAQMFYKQDGSSLGQGEVVFKRRADADKVLTTLQGVPLDGRGLQLAIVGVASAPAADKGDTEVGQHELRGTLVLVEDENSNQRLQESDGGRPFPSMLRMGKGRNIKKETKLAREHARNEQGLHGKQLKRTVKAHLQDVGLKRHKTKSERIASTAKKIGGFCCGICGIRVDTYPHLKEHSKKCKIMRQVICSCKAGKKLCSCEARKN